MIVLRQEQIEALGIVALTVFGERVAGHLRRFFPRQTAKLGDELPRFVMHTIERARLHGITTQRDICRYAGVAILLGYDFDEQVDWVKRLLASPIDATTRVGILVSRALERLSATETPE